MSTWGDFIFSSVHEFESTMKGNLKRKALNKFKKIVLTYSDRTHYDVLQDYLCNLVMILYNSLDLSDIPLEEVDDFIKFKEIELTKEIDRIFVNYNFYRIKEELSRFCFGNYDGVYNSDVKAKPYHYLIKKTKKRKFANVNANKDVSE